MSKKIIYIIIILIIILVLGIFARNLINNKKMKKILLYKIHIITIMITKKKLKLRRKMKI